MQIFQSFTKEVSQLLLSGAIGVIPTDTVYGLVTPLSNRDSVRRLYNIKNRPAEQAIGTVIFNDPLQLDDIVSARDLLAAEVYWPGPTSVLLHVSGGFDYAKGNYDALPFRIPVNPSLQALTKITGPLATTSANHTGEPPATTMQEALSYFRESVDFYVDGGDLSGRRASRIIRIRDNGSIEELRR